MKLIQDTPTTIRIPAEIAESLRDSFTYEDKKITYEWIKWKKVQAQDDQWQRLDPLRQSKTRRNWFIIKHSRFDLDQKVDQLQAARFKCLLFKDSKGYYTYSGLASQLKKIPNTTYEKTYELPLRDTINWYDEPEHEPRWYQSKSIELLCPDDYSSGHGAVELFTGAGKTLTMAMLLKKIGLPAVIMVPTLSIAEQLLFDFKNWFGPSMVGQYFDGKKQADRFFVVAVDDSLVRVKEDSPDYEALANKKVFVCDESHLVPAETLAGVALGLLKNIPYRYFFSGTQLRSDGLGLLLDAIIGDVVIELDVKKGIEGKFIAPLKFVQWKATSDNKMQIDDPIESTRVHLRANQKINNHAVRLAKYAVSKGRKVLILIQEVKQFPFLVKAGILDLNIGFAHGGGLKKEEKAILPEQFRKCDNRQLVKDFDDNKIQVLVGTSCVQVGTDIKSVSCIINLVGLASEVQIRQGVIGRGTRLFPGKTDCVINDYTVINIEKQLTHGKKRAKIFNQVYGPVQYLEMK